MRQPGEKRISGRARHFAARSALSAALIGLCGASPLLCAQGLPDLGAAPGTLKAEDLMPAEVAEYAKRKWMWSLADLAGGPEPKQASRLKDAEPNKPSGGWMLYGRIGVLRWQNDLGDEDLSSFRFGLRHAPPKLGGRAYIGLYKRF